MLTILALGCTHALDRLEPGECREDTDCPGRLTCNHPVGVPGELGTCGCSDDIDCPAGLMCDEGRCTDRQGCASGRCCLETPDCGGGVCHAGLCFDSDPGLDGLYRLSDMSPPPLDASPALDTRVLEPDALPALNACHGRLTLRDRPGTLCECGGTWACTGPDSVGCSVPLNASDPRDETRIIVGEQCDTCGSWTCIGDKVLCGGMVVDGERRSIGDWWLAVHEGQWKCHRLTCAESDDGIVPVVVPVEGVPCGGCRAPPEIEDMPCGVCSGNSGGGFWECRRNARGQPVLDATGMPLMLCAGEEGVNTCGGCGALQVEAEPPAPGGAAPAFGQECGPCGTGRYDCQNRSTLVCVGAQAAQPEDCNGRDDDCDDNVDEDIDLLTDTSHCGQCGRSCLFDHGEGICDGGQCRLHRCDEGFVDLNNDDADGCECEQAPIERCGNGADEDCDGRIDECTCDEACQALGRGCPAGGGCEPSCPPGRVDRNRLPVDGCECVQQAVLCDDLDDDCDGDIDETDACL